MLVRRLPQFVQRQVCLKNLERGLGKKLHLLLARGVLGQHTVSCADDSAMSYMPEVSYAPYSISARDPC